MFAMIRNWWRNRRAGVSTVNDIVVHDDGTAISVAFPDGARDVMRWAELVQIEVHTNDSGPWGCDVWWVLVGESGKCCYPQGASGDQEMIPKYEALQGFDDRTLIKAMGCTSNKQFVCWRKGSAA